MSAVCTSMRVLVGLCAAVMIAGCGPSPIPVQGVVTYEGKPLANAYVLFNASEPGKDAGGSTDSQGVFHLKTGAADGAFPGEYKVTVQYSEPVEVPANLRTAEEVQTA